MKPETLSKLEKYVPPLENRKGKTRLDFNENLSGIPEGLLNKIKSFKVDLLSAYPEYNKLYFELSKYLKINKEQLIISNGSDDIIRLVFMAFLNKDDKVIIPSPTFSMFRINANLVGAKIIDISALSKNFSQEILKKIEEVKPKLIVIVNPNNPTGTSISLKEIKKILLKAKENNSLVLVDEAYFEFYNVSALDLNLEFNNLIVTRTFSKAFGLAGLRIGYACSNENIINNLKKIISPYPVSSFSVFAALEAIKENKYVNEYCLEVKLNKSILAKKLRCLGFNVIDGDANFIILKSRSYKLIYKFLYEKDILVRDISKSMKNCLRITVGTKKEVNYLIKCLKEIVNKKDIILFDLDGVIADVNLSYNQTIKQTVFYFTNKKISDNYIQIFRQTSKINNDWYLTFEIIKKLNNKKDKSTRKNNLSKNFNFNKVKNIFQKKYLGKKTISEGMINYSGLINNESLMINKKTLEKLFRKNYLGIVTGRPAKEAEYFLKKFNISKLFTVVITLDDVKEDKPSPEGIIKAIKKINNSKCFQKNDFNTDSSLINYSKVNLKSKPKIIYVGDNITDVNASLSANIIPIGFIPEYSVNKKNIRKQLLYSGAIEVIDNSSELLSKISSVINCNNANKVGKKKLQSNIGINNGGE